MSRAANSVSAAWAHRHVNSTLCVCTEGERRRSSQQHVTAAIRTGSQTTGELRAGWRRLQQRLLQALCLDHHMPRHLATPP